MSWIHPRAGRAFASALTVLGLLGSAGAAAAFAPGVAQAATASQEPHTQRCALISGHLYLGDPGAGPRITVTCTVSVLQVNPINDGVITRLRATHKGHHYKSDYSISPTAFSVPATGYSFLKWVNHPKAVLIHCHLTGGHLYLGATTIPHPHIVVCSVGYYQVNPHADGVIIRLRFTSGRHHYKDDYSLTLPNFHPKPTGDSGIPWLQ